MENKDKELGNHRDLNDCIANSRKIQEDIQSSKEVWTEIEDYVFNERKAKWKDNHSNRSVSLLYMEGVGLENRFLDNKYALLQEALRN